MLSRWLRRLSETEELSAEFPLPAWWPLSAWVSSCWVSTAHLYPYLAACPCGGELCARAFHSRREDQRIALRITETSAITRPVIQPATFCEERIAPSATPIPITPPVAITRTNADCNRGALAPVGQHRDVCQRALAAILCSLAVACHAGGVLSVLPF